MSDADQDQTTEGGALRKQLEDALKEVKQLKDSNAKMAADLRSGSLTSLFTEAKANPKAAKFYPADAPVTEEAIQEWLKGDGDVFAAPPAAPGTPAPPAAPGAVAPGTDQVTPAPAFNFPGMLPADVLAAAQQIAGMAPSAPQVPANLDDLASRVGRASMTSTDDQQALSDLWTGIRATAAAQLAQGM